MIRLLFYIASYKSRTFSIFSNFLSIEIRFIFVQVAATRSEHFHVMLWKITKLSQIYSRISERQNARKVFPILFCSRSWKLNYISTEFTSLCAMGGKKEMRKIFQFSRNEILIYCFEFRCESARFNWFVAVNILQLIKLRSFPGKFHEKSFSHCKRLKVFLHLSLNYKKAIRGCDTRIQIFKSCLSRDLIF